MNVEVATAEDSDIGTVKNILGNHRVEDLVGVGFTCGSGFGVSLGNGDVVLVGDGLVSLLRGFGFEKELSGINPAAPIPFCVCSYPVNLSITLCLSFCFGKLLLTPPPITLISLS